MSEKPVHSRLRMLVDRRPRAQESLDPGNVVVRRFFTAQCFRVGADRAVRCQAAHFGHDCGGHYLHQRDVSGEAAWNLPAPDDQP
jgi:hypothetical protein